jgi:hypothetical protein
MQKKSIAPDYERLSFLTAIILLVYALTQFVRQPVSQLAIQLPGFFLPIPFNFRNLVWVGIAILAASGMDWILEGQPGLRPGSRIEHWILPALTAWVIGVPLYSLPTGTTWWVVYIIGGILLTMVFLAEFYCADPDNDRSTLAALGLIGISFALFLILAVSLRFSGARLYLVAPAVALSAVLVSMRTLFLRTGGNWSYAWAGAIALLVTQIAIGLFYLPIQPFQFGLVLVGILYAAINVADRTNQHSLTLQDMIEPGAAIGLSILLALII